MAQFIKLPDGSYAQFDDGASDEFITSTLQREMPELYSVKSPITVEQNDGFAGDTALDIKRGIQQIPGALAGIADIPLAFVFGARPVDTATDWVGEKTGFQPGKWAKESEAQYSPERQAQQQAVGKAWDDAGGSELSRVIFDPSRWNELPTAWDRADAQAIFTALKDNPRATLGTVFESLPSMAAGMGVSKVAQVLGKFGMAASAGIGEGAITAGQAMDQINEKVDPRVAATAALGSGLLTGGIGAASAKVASKIGLPDVDQALLKQTGEASELAAKYPWYVRAPVAATQEGVLEELPQSMQEQVWQNWAEDKPLGEGVLRAGVEGAIAGGLTGGVFGLKKPTQVEDILNTKDGDEARQTFVESLADTTNASIDTLNQTATDLYRLNNGIGEVNAGELTRQLSLDNDARINEILARVASEEDAAKIDAMSSYTNDSELPIIGQSQSADILRQIAQRSVAALPNHPSMPVEATADGTFAGSGTLNIDRDGNVVLQRVAGSIDDLTKSGNQRAGLQDLIDQSMFHGGGLQTDAISTSGDANFTAGYGLSRFGNDRTVGTFRIPINDLLAMIDRGEATIGNIGEGEILLSGSAASSYLREINGRPISKTTTASSGAFNESDWVQPRAVTPAILELADTVRGMAPEQQAKVLSRLQPHQQEAVQRVLSQAPVEIAQADPLTRQAGGTAAQVQADQIESVPGLGTNPAKVDTNVPAYDLRTARGIASAQGGMEVRPHRSTPGKYEVVPVMDGQQRIEAQAQQQADQRLAMGANEQAAANLQALAEQDGNAGAPQPGALPDFLNTDERILKQWAKSKIPEIATGAKAELSRRQSQQIPQAERDMLNQAALDAEQSLEATNRDDLRNAKKNAVDPDRIIVGRTKARLAQAIGRLFGTEVKFYNDAGKAQGKVIRGEDNTVYLNVRGNISPLAVLGHEMTHLLRTRHEGAWNKIAEVVKESMTTEQKEAFYRNYFSSKEHANKIKILEAAKKQGKLEELFAVSPKAIGYTNSYATLNDLLLEELISDLGGNRFMDTQFWEQVFDKIVKAEGRTKGQQIIDRMLQALLKAINGVKKMFAKDQGFTAADRLMKENLEQITEAMSTAYATMFKESKNWVAEDIGSYYEATNADERAAGEAAVTPKNTPAPTPKTGSTADDIEAMEDGVKETLLRSDFTDPEERVTVSTTVPTPAEKKGRTSNPITENWVIDTEDMRAGNNHMQAAIEAISQYNTVIADPAQGEEVLAKLRKVVVDNLLKLHDLMPENIRERAKLWYDGANRIANDWTRLYDITTRQAAGVLAIFSPQMDWFKNVSLAERAILIYKQHGGTQWSTDMTAWVQSYVDAAATLKDREDRMRLLDDAKRLEGKTMRFMTPADKARFIRVFDETYFERSYRIITPEGGFGDYVTKGEENEDGDLEEASVTWGSFATIEKAISVLQDGSFKNVSEKLGNEHKVRNFFNNIIAPNSADGHVTIDTHAIAAAMFKALSGKAVEVSHNFGTTPKGKASAGQSKATGASGTYGLFADAYREAAAQRGLLAREMQSITWEAVRSLFPAGKKKQMQPKIEAVWDQFKAGKIDRVEAERQVMEISGGLRPMQWEGHSEGQFAAEGGFSFNHAQQQPRLLPAANTKEKVTISLSAYTKSIAPLRRLRNLADKGDAKAQALLQSIALDGVKEMLRGTSAVIKVENVTGLYGGATEPSLSATVTFNHAERADVLARVRQFADTFDQEQVHVLRKTSEKPGHQYSDGSYATVVYRWELNQSLSRKEIAKIIKDSNLYGLTFGDNFILAYFVHQDGATKKDGSPYTSQEQIDDFIAKSSSVGELLGSRSTSSRREVARLWAYGDRGGGAIGWPGISSALPAEQGVRQESIRVAKQYIESIRPDDAGSTGVGERAAGLAKASERREGAVEGVGVHYSNQQRSTLSSAAFGTGLQGAEWERVKTATDPRLKHRIYFYMNVGRGINPEAGVGGFAHTANLENLYDHTNDTLDLKVGRDANEFESAVLDAGFDGYMSQESGIAILLGERSQAVEFAGSGVKPGVDRAGQAPRSAYGTLQQAVLSHRGLPYGQMSGADWKRTMAALMPEVDVSHLDDTKNYYRDGIVKRPKKADNTRRDIAPNRTAPSGAVSFSERRILDQVAGKKITRQATIAETGETVQLKNQDAAASIKELRGDIEALEALRLCAGV